MGDEHLAYLCEIDRLLVEVRTRLWAYLQDISDVTMLPPPERLLQLGVETMQITPAPCGDRVGLTDIEAQEAYYKAVGEQLDEMKKEAGRGNK